MANVQIIAPESSGSVYFNYRGTFSIVLLGVANATYNFIYRVSQEKWTKLRESVPYVIIYRYNPKHLYPKLNGYGGNGQRSLKL